MTANYDVNKIYNRINSLEQKATLLSLIFSLIEKGIDQAVKRRRKTDIFKITKHPKNQHQTIRLMKRSKKAMLFYNTSCNLKCMLSKLSAFNKYVASNRTKKAQNILSDESNNEETFFTLSMKEEDFNNDMEFDYSHSHDYIHKEREMNNEVLEHLNNKNNLNTIEPFPLNKNEMNVKEIPSVNNNNVEQSNHLEKNDVFDIQVSSNHSQSESKNNHSFELIYKYMNEDWNKNDPLNTLTFDK